MYNALKHIAQKLQRNKVLQSGIHISKRFHENEDTERSSHPKMNSPNENKKYGILLFRQGKTIIKLIM
jgi:hypothetical protein